MGAGPGLGDETLDGLRTIIAEHAPEVIVASGDLTHRNRVSQHGEAAAFLRSLGPPVLAVPGNHDIPALPPRRFTRTYAAFVREWDETEPVYHSDALTIAGVNSVRPWLYQEGLVNAGQLGRLEREFAERPDAARVVVTHHHLASAPWRTGKRPLARRSSLLKALAGLGVDLVLAGHVHQTSAAVATEFYAESARSVVASTTAGLGRPRLGRHAEVRGCALWHLDAGDVRSITFGWVGGELRELARRAFPRAAR